MKPIIFLIAVCSLNAASLLAQKDVDEAAKLNTQDKFRRGDFNPTAYGVIYGWSGGSSGGVVGDYFETRDYQPNGGIWFYPWRIVYENRAIQVDSIMEVGLRLDLKNNEVHIKTPYGERALPGEKVRYFEYKDGNGISHTFLNMKEYRTDNDELKGFVEVLSTGDLQLLRYNYIWEKQPTYSAALEVGNKDLTYIKKYRYYYAKGKKLTKLKPSTGGLLKLMSNKKTKMEAFFKENTLDMKKEADVVKAFDYYNSL